MCPEESYDTPRWPQRHNNIQTLTFMKAPCSSPIFLVFPNSLSLIPAHPRSSGLSAPSCVPSVASGIAERARAAPGVFKHGIRYWLLPKARSANKTLTPGL